MATSPAPALAPDLLEEDLKRALELEAAGDGAQAERLFARIIAQRPGHAGASLGLARFEVSRQRFPQAEALLATAHAQHPDDEDVATMLSTLRAATGRLKEALVPLEAVLALRPDACTAWLMLGAVRDRLGDSRGALKASHQAITRAQRAGRWHSQLSTPRPLLKAVAEAAQRVRSGRKELFFGSYEDLRAAHGDAPLQRVDTALRTYLKEIHLPPPDPRQKPIFFYFPGLPDAPYQDPFLQPWAPHLRDAFPAIREEAMRIVREDAVLPDFIRVPPQRSPDDYLGGLSPEPSWQAFFFYRHGKRYDANHLRCPATSTALESIELCRIADQAPEICFSVLRPKTDIKPHYGVTNIRQVMHLPLVVPEGCALNVIDHEARAWREGELLMFDDTYQHEAWNHSDQTRIILLMDCWNPHLTAIERDACKRVIEMISSLGPAPAG
jgi:aspartate beta-hydroxylase